MSRTVPSGSSRQQSENSAPTVKSDTGPAAEIAIRRRRGSNHASEVSTNAYGKMNSSFNAGLLDLAPERGHRERVRGLVDRHHDEAAGQEHQAAEADLRRDDERRAVAAGDQVGEHAEPGHRQHGQRDQRRLREQHPARAPVEPLVERPDAVERLHARAEEPAPAGPPAPARSPAGVVRGDAGQEAALAEVGEQAREPRRARRAEALLGERRSGRPASACRRAARRSSRRCPTAAGRCSC